MREIIDTLDENLYYLDHQIFDDYISVLVSSTREEAPCPFCGRISSRIHSVYERSFQDLPIQGKKVYISIINKKFFCDNDDCTHTTFAESFDCLKPKSKKSERLINEIMRLSVEVSSITASKLLKSGGIDAGKSTICNILKKNGRAVGQG